MDFDERVIRRKHVENAIKRYCLERPKHKPARSAFLLWNGEKLPAKYILRLAFQNATGFMPKPETLTGGEASIRVLKDLGFETCYEEPKRRSANRNPIKSARRAALKGILEKHYGPVEREWKNPLISVPDLVNRRGMDNNINRIFEALRKHRRMEIRGKKGHKLAFDFFIMQLNLPIEFDERQHFTPLRQVSLENYPVYAHLGFPRDRWIQLSKKIRAGDNSPIYRDEQRALYDSIRDLMAPQVGLLPVVRVFEEDVEWERTGENCEEGKRFLVKLETIIRDHR
ncbi:MAG: hypothetical protein WC647_17395 [Desulfomonilaceae bacterium]|jgi:hypothetical protein